MQTLSQLLPLTESGQLNIMVINIIQRNGQYFLQEVEAITEFQYLEQVVAGPFDTKWKADVHRSYEYPSYRGLTDEHCRLQH